MNHPKILLLDIETSPDLAYVWRVYDSNAIQIKEHWRILSYAVDWYHDPKPRVYALDDFGGFKAGDKAEKKLLHTLHMALDSADIVVAHNGKQFDVRKINARFLALGFSPPSPYKLVDTKKELSRVFGFSSNKLDWLSRQLSLGKKVDHSGFELWVGCMADDPKWWKVMKRYNLHDVKLMRTLYTKVAGWIRQPNASLYSGGFVCSNPACGSTKLQSRGVEHLKTRAYRRLWCTKCGKWSRMTINAVKKTEVTEVS